MKNWRDLHNKNESGQWEEAYATQWFIWASTGREEIRPQRGVITKRLFLRLHNLDFVKGRRMCVGFEELCLVAVQTNAQRTRGFSYFLSSLLSLMRTLCCNAASVRDLDVIRESAKYTKK